MINYYIVLGINKNATQNEIKNAYMELIKKNHPDKGGDKKIFRVIIEAYETLSNENKRQEYNKVLNDVEIADHFKLKEEYNTYNKHLKTEPEKDKLDTNNKLSKVFEQIKDCKNKEKYEKIIKRDFPDFKKKKSKMLKTEEKQEKINEFTEWYNKLGENKEEELNKYLEKYHYPKFPPKYIPITDEFMERWIKEKKNHLEDAITSLKIIREQDECEHQPEKIFEDGNFSQNEENRKKFNELFEKMKIESSKKTDIIPAEKMCSVAIFDDHELDEQNWFNHRITKEDVKNIKIKEKEEVPINLDEFIRLRKLEDDEIHKTILGTGNKMETFNGEERLFNVEISKLKKEVKTEYKEEKEIYEKLKTT